MQATSQNKESFSSKPRSVFTKSAPDMQHTSEINNLANSFYIFCRRFGHSTRAGMLGILTPHSFTSLTEENAGSRFVKSIP